MRRPQRFVQLDDTTVPAELVAPLEHDPLLELDALRLRRAVLALPEDLREIARREGLSSVAIRKRLRRAVSRLRAELEERAP